nr:hemerythrin domain-containing protein [uncultured Bacteroides sp.]
MINASEELRREHELIKTALNLLEKIASGIVQKVNPDVSDLTELINFVIVFADKCHHGKEEDLYFPSLEEAGIPNHGGPIGVMLAEHDQGRKYIREMKENISGQNSDLQVFADAAFTYVALMRNHIEKENNILFMMGDRAMPESVQNDLLIRFKEHEGKVIDNEKLEEFYALIERLSQKYLH